jgi:hypothetical protein
MAIKQIRQVPRIACPPLSALSAFPVVGHSWLARGFPAAVESSSQQNSGWCLRPGIAAWCGKPKTKNKG